MQQTPESALIGDLIEDPRCLMNVRRYVNDSSAFTDNKLATIYDCILRANDERGTFDLPILSDAVARNGVPASDLMLCLQFASPAMAEQHARVVAQEHMRRTTVKALLEVQKDLSTGADVFDAINTATTLLSNLKRGFEQEKTVHISHVVQEAIDELDDILAGRKSMGLPFGFSDLDKVTGGMDNGDLVVIAAPEKSGKSTLMIQIVFNNAAKGTPCLVFSSEMMRKQILYRKALMDTKVRWIDVKRNMIDERQRNAIYKRMQELASLPIFIRHGVFSIVDIIAESARYVQDKGVKLIAVDYIQRVVPVSKRTNENREREVAAISSGLKSIAMENAIPVLALSQVNDDLRARESRAIEQDMDKMITIDNRPEQGDGAKGVDVPIRVRQRMGLSGNMGDLKLHYDLINGIWYSGFDEDDTHRQTFLSGLMRQCTVTINEEEIKVTVEYHVEPGQNGGRTDPS
jgi:replicative DNA helicase